MPMDGIPVIFTKLMDCAMSQVVAHSFNMIFFSSGWNSARKESGHRDMFGKGVTTAFAGFLALSALNALLILILGNQHDTAK